MGTKHLVADEEQQCQYPSRRRVLQNKPGSHTAADAEDIARPSTKSPHIKMVNRGKVR